MSYFVRISLLFFCAAFLFSCRKEEVIEVGTFEVSLSSTSASDKTVKPFEPFRTTINASAGAANLKGLLVLQDGEAVDFHRIKINDRPLEGNPYIIYPPDDAGFKFVVEIIAPDKTGDYVFTFKVVDFSDAVMNVSRNIKVEAASPTLKYNGPELVIVKKGNEAIYKLNGLPKDGKLRTLEVLINGSKLANANLVSFGAQSPTANPFPLDISFENGFDRDLKLIAPTTAGNYVYTFILTDEFGASARDSADVLVGEPAIELLTKDLYNIAKDSVSGGLSLLTGNTGKPDTMDGPIIIDLGLQPGNDDPASNWLRQIRGGNGLEIRYLKNGQMNLPQTFTYQRVETQEQIALLFENNGISFTQKDAQNRLISDPLQIGQILVVKYGLTKYFLLKTVLVSSDASSNDDYYRFNIKQ